MVRKAFHVNEKGGEFYTMTSKRAHYLGNGEIKFKGKVEKATQHQSAL
jgi:hypothetical protein